MVQRRHDGSGEKLQNASHNGSNNMVCNWQPPRDDAGERDASMYPSPSRFDRAGVRSYKVVAVREALRNHAYDDTRVLDSMLEDLLDRLVESEGEDSHT